MARPIPILTAIFVPTTFIATILRFVAKARNRLSFAADDSFVVSGLVSYSVYSGLSIWSTFPLFLVEQVRQTM